MAEVVYLKQGERAPKRKSSPFLLIVCRRRRGEVMQIGADGTLQTIRTSPEHIADNLNGLLGTDLKIYVQGVPSRAEAELRAKSVRGTKRWPRPTIEDLQRENELRVALDDKLRSTTGTLAHLDAAPPHNDVSGSVERVIADYLSAAPQDDYGQRRAIEMLFRALPKLVPGIKVE